MKSGYIDSEILQQAIDRWGEVAQIEMIEEECLELALALQKFKRANRGKDNIAKRYSEVIGEIADVKIMINQSEKIFSKSMINDQIDFKMQRLKERLEK